VAPALRPRRRSHSSADCLNPPPGRDVSPALLCRCSVTLDESTRRPTATSFASCSLESV
jgi:hypothetical protein